MNIQSKKYIEAVTNTPESSIEDLLMDVITELSYANKAYKNELSEIFYPDMEFMGLMNFEDYIGKAFIIIFTICKSCNIKDLGELIPQTHQFRDTVSIFLYDKVIRQIYRIDATGDFVSLWETDSYRYLCEVLLGMCEKLEIDIVPYIEKWLEE